MRPGLRDLTYLTADLPGIGGKIKHEIEDFEVEEIPSYDPSGDGEHLFLWIEKRDISAGDLIRHVSRKLETPLAEIGSAGLKDRRAVTRQYISVPVSCASRLDKLDTPDIKLLHSQPHKHKLRTGHSRGNRFSILVRDPVADAAALAEPLAERIRERGFPNYFGEQRFGRDGETSKLGFALLRGEKQSSQIPRNKRRFLLRLALSAAQAELFNTALSDRLQEDGLSTLLLGDVMQVIASGGPFVVEDLAVEQQRYQLGETMVTGPMFGPKMRKPTDIVAEREAHLLEQNSLSTESFTQYRKLTAGMRRPYLIRPGDLQIATEPAGVRFRFTLPSGVYATTMLREFMKPPATGSKTL